jgi:hypothetical protein
MAILNIILHGLFFLELKSTTTLNWLEITAPNLQANHDLSMGVPGNLQNINGQIIPWEQLPGLNGGSPGKLIGGIPMDVPDQIYQFSRHETEVGNIDKQGNQGIIRLPWPKQWRTIRLGDRPSLTTRLSQKSVNTQVHTNIENRCNNVIGVATVLTYDYALSLPPIPGWSPSLNLEIYFQPKDPESIADVNDDLRTASAQLFSSDNFDLAIIDSGSSSNASTPIGKTLYPEHSGLSIGDELFLNELVRVIDPSMIDNIDVKDAIVKLQLFLLTLPPIIFESNIVPHQMPPTSQQESHGIRKMDQIESLNPLNILMASPANCPMFFLGI